ncbi:MAG: IPT/TIG domain-containing protein [Bryobacteraceae bacterium]
MVRKMTPGIHSLVIDFSTVDHSPASHARLGVTLNLSAPSTPNIQTAVNTASYLSSLSPGAMVSIFGTHLGRQPGASAPYSEFGLYPTDLSDTAVTFNGIAAPLLYVGPSQINALVPYGLAGQKTANVVVTRFPGLTSQSSNAFTIPIADTSPAIFTSTSNGRGQGTFLLYPDSSYNSPDNPAPPGSAVTLFATGAGVWSPSVPDGAINLENYALPPNLPWFNTRPVSLTIGGKAARLIYTGGVLYQVWGLLQINAIIPEGIASGPQPVILTIGQNSNADQKITIAIK